MAQNLRRVNIRRRHNAVNTKVNWKRQMTSGALVLVESSVLCQEYRRRQSPKRHTSIKQKMLSSVKLRENELS